MPPYDPQQPYNSLPSLPPAVEIETIGVMRALNLASRALANLNGTALSVPNPRLLIDTFAITEAQASLRDRERQHHERRVVQIHGGWQ